MSIAKTAKSAANSNGNGAKAAVEAAVPETRAADVTVESLEIVASAAPARAAQAAPAAVPQLQAAVASFAKPFAAFGQFDGVFGAGTEAFRGYEEILRFNRDNFEALVKTSSIAVRGAQDLSKHLVHLTQESFEESVAAGKSLIEAKTFKEFVDVSQTLTRSNFDKLVAESTRLGELSAKLAQELMAPINSRVDVAMHKFSRGAS